MKVLDLYNNEVHDFPRKNIELTQRKIYLESLNDTNRDIRIRACIKTVLKRYYYILKIDQHRCELPIIRETILLASLITL